MTDDTPYFVAQCARAIASKEQCWYRPASVVSKALTPLAHGQCAVWITCQHGGMLTCYRFTYSRLGQYRTPILSNPNCQKQDARGQYFVSMWSVPGNVRDLAETIARIWLKVPV